MAEQASQELRCREYQVEFFDMARNNNYILYLPTGSGKTFIVILLIKHYANMDRDRILMPIEKGGVRSFILVNNRASVYEQAKNIASQITLTVGKFSEDMSVGLWEDEVWRVTISEKQILVMTTQIFLDILKRKLISLKNVNLLVFDECHKAVSDHPLRQIMQCFKDIPPKQQPRVLGLTATLLNGDIKPNDVEKEIRNLEKTLNARVLPSFNEDTVKLYPVESKVSYNENDCSHTSYVFCSKVFAHLKAILEINKEEDCQLPASCRPNNCRLVDESRKINTKLVNFIDDVELIMKVLGIYGGSLAVLENLVKIQQVLTKVQDENCKIIHHIFCSDFEYLRKYLEIVMIGWSDLDQLSRFSSDKVIKLFAILRYLKSSGSAIVFVKKRFSAKILYHLLRKAAIIDKTLSHLKCNFLIGSNVNNPLEDTRENYLLRKQNALVINEFNQGALNVLITTNVVEESVDISKCNYVVMFDTDLDFQAYIQSKGRAQDIDSHYILMLSTSDKLFPEKYFSYKCVEETLKKVLCMVKSRFITGPALEEVDETLLVAIPGLDPYSPKGPNGPVITVRSAIPTINRYFESLKVDKFTNINHAWYIEEENHKFRCHLQLPSEANYHAIVRGLFQSTLENAKRSVALEACKILHQSKDLDDEHFLPVNVEEVKKTCNFTPNFDESEIFEEIVDGKPVKVGTKNNKRTYEKKWSDALTGCGPDPHKEIYLHLIEITPIYSPPLDNHRLLIVHELLSQPNHFAILSSKDLPSLAPFPLYMSVGELEANVHQGSKIKLNDEQIKKISEFHFTIFDSVLEVAKTFMIKDSSNFYNAYLVAPVVKDNTGVRIDWGAIEECRKPFLSPCNKPTKEDRMDIQVNDENYFGRTVTPWYRTVPSQRYIVTKVCYDMSEDTQFPTDNYESYKEYFKEKYKIEPYLQGQPLLEVRAISSRLNNVKPKASTKQQKRKNKEENEEFEVWLLPEFCLVYPLPGKYWLKAQLLPSALHRIGQLCLVEELRCSIAKQTGIGTIEPTSLFKLEEDLSLKKNKDPDQDKPQALKPLNLYQNSCKVNVPDVWASEEEPVDIARQLESVTLFDVLTHENFIQKSLTKTLSCNTNISLSNVSGPTKSNTNKMVNPPPLYLLKKDHGPQQVALLQALTAASSNDFINCERFGTLGDSFLKFAVSVILFDTQKFTEEHLTNIKDSIVGYKNLYFCGKNKNVGPMLGVDEFLPNEDWVPPRFHVPLSVQNVIKLAKINVNCLYRVVIPDADRKCEEMTPIAEGLYHDALLNFSEDLLLISQSCSFTNQIAMTDKNISDAVNAIVGVHLESSGMFGALKVMNWFGVTDPNLCTWEVFTERPKSAVRSSGDPYHLHLEQPEVLENTLHYGFKTQYFLLQALTHPSYTFNNITKSYQTLEFLGKAVIDFLITVYIFENCSKLTPDELKDLRSALVDNITLACIAVRNNFHKFLLYHSSKLNTCILSFAENREEGNHVVDKDILFLVEENDVNTVEAVDVPKALGDVFKSLMGAVYLDSGKDLYVTWRVLFNLMKTEIETFCNDVPKNHVKMLYESGSIPEFHRVTYYLPGIVMVAVDITHNSQVQRFNGFGQNKCQAKRAAAKLALRHLRSVL